MLKDTVSFDVEAFAALHPAMDPSLIPFARAALNLYGESTRRFRALQDDASHQAMISFVPPDPRTQATYEREKIVEFGAIVIAGLLLGAWEHKQITRVCKRGSRVDYFVGEASGDERWILEVGGTDQGSHQATRTDKRRQLEDSFYRRAPFKKAGFVGVTRFAEPSVTSLDTVSAEAL